MCPTLLHPCWAKCKVGRDVNDHGPTEPMFCLQLFQINIVGAYGTRPKGSMGSCDSAVISQLSPSWDR